MGGISAGRVVYVFCTQFRATPLRLCYKNGCGRSLSLENPSFPSTMSSNDYYKDSASNPQGPAHGPPPQYFQGQTNPQGGSQRYVTQPPQPTYYPGPVQQSYSTHQQPQVVYVEQPQRTQNNAEEGCLACLSTLLCCCCLGSLCC